MTKGSKRKLLSEKNEKSKPKNPKLIKEKKVRLFLDYWKVKSFRNSGPNQLNKDATAVRKLLRGTLYNNSIFQKDYGHTKFSIDDFILAVNRFHQSCIDTEVAPSDKKYIKRTSLSEFLLNSFAKQQITQSYFLHFLSNEPLPINGKIHSKNPILAKKIAKEFCHRFYQGIVSPKELNINIQNKLNKASDRLVDYFDLNKDNLNLNSLTLDQMVSILFEAVYKFTPDDTDITAGYFCSDLTFNDRIPKYLLSQKLVKTKKDKKKKQLGRLL